MTSTTKGVLIAVLLGLSALVPAAIAGQPVTQTLTPAPLQFYTCKAVGNGTICDGSFPTTLLTMWGRDRASGRLDLPFLFQRQCRDTARTVGLFDRGVLLPGYKADVNVIDTERLVARRPEIRYDLPAGGRRLLQPLADQPAALDEHAAAPPPPHPPQDGVAAALQADV